MALLRLRGPVHGDAIGWRCQLRRVRLDEATSVNETSQRETKRFMTFSFTNIGHRDTNEAGAAAASAAGNLQQQIVLLLMHAGAEADAVKRKH